MSNEKTYQFGQFVFLKEEDRDEFAAWRQKFINQTSSLWSLTKSVQCINKSGNSFIRYLNTEIEFDFLSDSEKDMLFIFPPAATFN